MEAPPPQVEIVVVHPPRLAPLGGEAVFAGRRLDIATLRAAVRLDDALKQDPAAGLFRRTGSDAANPTIQGLSLRGFAPSGAGRALVTLDGVPMNDPFGGWVIWSALPPESLAGVTLVPGAGAGPYGAGALTGVVTLQERAAGEGLQALDASLGSLRRARVAAVGGASGLLAAASFQTSAGYVPVRGAAAGPADRRAGLSSGSLALRLGRRLGATDAALRLDAFEEDRGAGLAGAKSRARGAGASLTLAQAPAEGGGWRLAAWVRRSDLANSSVAVAAGRGSTTPANDQYATPALGYGLNAALQARAGGLRWETGVDLRGAEGFDHERFRYLNGAFTRARKAGGHTYVGGLYAEAALDRGPLLLAGGVRADAWGAGGGVRRETDLATGAQTLDLRPAGAHGVTPTARIGARYQASPALWVRAAAYAGFRPPTLNELHRPFRVGNDITEANPALKPERLAGAEAGLGGAAWGATLFYNRLQDPVTNVTLLIGPATSPIAGVIPAGGVLRQRQNVGAIDAWGLEGEAHGRLGEALGWRAAAQLADARVDGGTGAPQLTGKRPAQAARTTLTAGADWRCRPHLTLSAQLRYESSRFEDDLNTRRLGAGADLDARASWSLGGGREIYLAVDNLAGARLQVGKTADGVASYAAPRTLRAGFSFGLEPRS